MVVNREATLKVLESVSPGLSPRDTIEQSSCLVFTGGRVVTFNEEILCSRVSPLAGIEGAVKAKPLLELLSKLPDEDVGIMQQGTNLLINGGKTKRSCIAMETDVLLPIESVEEPSQWRDLSPEFAEAVNIVHTCASTDESQFALTCVHITENYMEACDRYQIARYAIPTGVSMPILVRAESLKRVVGFDMTEVSETDSWIHFRNPAGLRLSLRRFVDEYKDLSDFINVSNAEPIVLPGTLEEVISRAEIFSGENALGNHVTVQLRDGTIQIEGAGAWGWHKERRAVKYQGEALAFSISPKLLLTISRKSNECQIKEGRLFIDTGKFRYVTCTVAKKKGPQPSESGS